MPRTILVENTEDRIHCIADLALRVDPVLTASPGSPAPPKDALLPGANEVDAEEWAKAEKIPLVQFYLKQGILKARKDSVADLPKLKPEEAVELVRKTFDEALLKRWFDLESRRSVKDVIDAQLKAISVPPAVK